MKTHKELTRGERIKKIISQRRKDVCLVLEDLSDEKNIAMILRTAESFSISKVYIIYSGKKPKLLNKESSGAKKWLEIEFFNDVKVCFKELKKHKFKIYGALVDPSAEVLWKEKFSGKVALCLGNEGSGLSQTAQNLADKNLYLPMFGLTESLNVSVSAGIFLYEIIRQKEK